MGTEKTWTFFRAGGFDQVKLATASDLADLQQLDQKLWVALACPTSGLEVDERTLSLIDSDKDGRVRAPELLAATQFACARLKAPAELMRGQTSLPLSSINDQNEAGRTLLASARQVLVNLGKANDAAISADDLTDPAKIFANTPFNGDGVVTELSTEDPFVQGVIRDIMQCVGSVLDRSGSSGVDATRVATFFDEIRAFADWLELARANPTILPLQAEQVAAAAQAVANVRVKVDDFFARCRLAEFDPRIAGTLNRREDEYDAIAARELSANAAEVASFPLAQVTAGRSLPLVGAVNPAHQAAIKTLYDDAIVPLLGERRQLSEADWNALNQRLLAYREWQDKKQGLKVETLGQARILQILDSSARQTLDELVAKDLALEAEAASIESVERLVLYYRDLFVICTNFVNFQDFYDGNDPAVFQCGTLYIDQRACRLCLRVNDAGKHASMAGLAGAYLAYADCSRPASGEKMQIVAVLTAGDTDNLMVGRNGLFYDRKGRDWDATITKIIENPISLRQAFWAPYKKFVRMVEEYVAKRAATANSESNAVLTTAASNAVNADKVEVPAPPRKIDVGSVAALGVAVGALGTFVTATVGYATGVLKLGIIATLAAIVGVMMLISLPSVVLAFVTLRKRNLGPILDANGWAINANAKINVSFGATLTSVSKLPAGARREARDRYADKGPPWKRIVLLFLLVMLALRWYEGQLDRVLPNTLKSTQVLGRFAPEKP